MTNEGIGESDNSTMIVVMIIGAIGIGGASVWMIARPRLITPDRDTRRYWQERATRNHPINPCQTGNSWCEMSKVEPQYNRYEIKSLDVLALANLIDSPRAQYEASNEVLKLLNRELIMTRNDLEWEKLRGRMKDVARMLLYEVSNWLAYQSAIYFIAFYANIEGSEVEFEFTLYQCPLNSWLQEVNWTAKLTDTRKLPINTLTNTINT
ncbi:MAG TPA: hypothetical protein PLZ51_21260, partial [Aggregatilineales bacterium]|nr:hypothetical protein [Aggregatilineales bacterium]